MVPAMQKALTLPQKQGNFAVTEISVPKPGAGEVLVKVMAAGLNPVDYGVKAYGIVVEEYPAVLGYELSGVVEEIGTGVIDLKVGDRIFAESASFKGHEGFQQYALAIASTIAMIPDNLSFDQAGSIGLTLSTAYIGLYQSFPDGFGLTAPTLTSPPAVEAGTPIVILGATTSVGQFAIQLAKYSGFNPIIATASISNAPYLKSLGASEVFDRNLNASELKAKIASVTSKNIKHVLAAHIAQSIQELSVEILDDRGRVSIVHPAPSIKSGSGKEVASVSAFLRDPKNIPILEPFFHDRAATFFEKGILKPNIVEVLPNGLHGIPDGLMRLGNGQVSALKLVVRPQETS